MKFGDGRARRRFEGRFVNVDENVAMRRAASIVLLLIIPPGATLVVSEVQRYPKRFAEIEADRLYRGAYPSAEQLRNLVGDWNIQTVVSLTGAVRTPEERGMLAAMRGLNLNHLRFPMPGNGCGDFAGLDQAADALADEAKGRIFFHCKAGKQRTSAVLAAYRMRHCGYSLGEALEELEGRYDLDRTGKERVLVDHLTRYAAHLGLPPMDKSDQSPGDG